MRARVIALVAAAALGVGACGDDEGDSAATQPPATTGAPAAGAETVTAAGLAISTDLSEKPEIPKPTGEPPEKLVTEDVVTGSGAAAKPGDQLVMHYVGVLHSNGEQFDASWDTGRPFPFTLGEGNVIQGWDQGIAGMKIGGRRLLVIPPDLAYGSQGQGSIGPDETLVFVVDLLNVTQG